MTNYGREWHTMGEGGARGSRKGPMGHQRPPGGTKLLPPSKRVIKQQNNVHSTQKVSRPKWGSIYSFLRHLGPLECIKTAIQGVPEKSVF